MFKFSLVKKLTFSQQLRIAFAILILFSLIQAGLTIWVAQESVYHIEKSRVSNRILTEFIDLGGNKQRLKVWLAQYLLTNDSSTEVKNALIFKMKNSLSSLQQLFVQDLNLSNPNSSEKTIISEQQGRYSTLKKNIEQLEFEIEKIDKNKKLDPAQAWKFMIQIFDSVDGNDLRKLINDAIEIQKLRAAEAETTAKNYIKYLNQSIYFLILLILIVTIFLALSLQGAVKNPINNLLMAATEYSKGNMSFRISDIPTNEFGILSSKFNEMAHELDKARTAEFKKRLVIEEAVSDRTRELKFALEKLQKSEFERKIFLSNISHELKTPATAILGEAAVTLRGGEKNVSDYKQSLQSIQIIGRQLSNRIDDLLLLARTDSDFFRINLTELSTLEIKPLIDEAIETIDPVSDVKFDIQNKIDLHKILLDRDRFVQMAIIILDNAVRYSAKSGTIAIKLYLENKNFIFSVTNSAENVKQIDFDQIFERYYRSHQARVLRPDGLGIGLHLAQTIVKAHYGSIQASAEGAENFKMEVRIPLKVIV